VNSRGIKIYKPDWAYSGDDWCLELYDNEDCDIEFLRNIFNAESWEECMSVSKHWLTNGELKIWDIIQILK
jgi:hypothetical protein